MGGLNTICAAKLRIYYRPTAPRSIYLSPRFRSKAPRYFRKVGKFLTKARNFVAPHGQTSAAAPFCHAELPQICAKFRHRHKSVASDFTNRRICINFAHNIVIRRNQCRSAPLPVCRSVSPRWSVSCSHSCCSARDSSVCARSKTLLSSTIGASKRSGIPPQWGALHNSP